MEANVHLSPLKTLTGRKYSFQKLTHFLWGNNVLYAEPSTIHGFHQGIHNDSSTQLNRPISKILVFVTFGNPDSHEVIVSKTNSFLTGRQCARCSSF
jgi:hypothetical protein